MHIYFLSVVALMLNSNTLMRLYWLTMHRILKFTEPDRKRSTIYYKASILSQVSLKNNKILTHACYLCKRELFTTN